MEDTILEGFSEGLELLFNKGAKLPNNSGPLMFRYLSTKDRTYLSVVKLLIEKGADCRYQEMKSYTYAPGKYCAVHSSLLAPAIDFDDEDLLKLLIAHQAPVNSETVGWNFSSIPDAIGAELLRLDPLYNSLMQEKLNFMQLLLDAGAKKSDNLDVHFGRQMRQISEKNLLREDHFSNLKIMVEKGFLNQSNFFRDMLLFSIHKKNDIRWVALLYDLGAQVKDYLNHAIQAKNKDIVKFLLEHGASL